MITCHKRFLIARCRERGYSLESVMPCVVAQHGDQWTIDETHPAYPRARTQLQPKAPTPTPIGQPERAGEPDTVTRPTPKGTGDHLHDLIRHFTKQEPTWSCGCLALIRQMNAWGPDKCWEKRELIVNHMMREAKARGMRLWPGSRAGALVLLRWAVARARRDARESMGEPCQKGQKG